MTEKWTKGPWIQFSDDTSGLLAILPAMRPGNIATIEAHHAPEPERKAIAQLISVAPALYAALKAACAGADHGLEHGDAYPDWYEPAMGLLARARGED